MKTKLIFLLFLAVLGIGYNSWAQVSYNKRSMGSIGTVPKAQRLSEWCHFGRRRYD